MAFQLEKDLTCSVCQDIFKEPVVLSCSHSFCKDCLKSWWREKPTLDCPVCKRRSSKSDPPRNLALKNLCEAFSQQRKTASEEQVCQLHSERLKLFCLKDQQPVCIVCRDSAAHRHHNFKPIAEATTDLKLNLQKSLSSLRGRLKLMEEFKDNCDLTLAHIKDQALHTEKQIDKQFLTLHSFLSQQQESRKKALREEEELKTKRMTDKMAAVSREIEALSESIRATEEELGAPDVSFLLNYKAAVERVQHCPLLEEEPQLGPGALIDQAKHLGNLTFNIWTNMKKLVQFTPVILDPNTAHRVLVLSDDLTSFTLDEEQKLPLNPERVKLDQELVLASVGFDSGSHSWEVEVGDSDEWDLGVVTQSAYYLTEDDEYYEEDAGWWSLEYCDNTYIAFNIDKKKDTAVKLKSKPRRIRLHLECGKRKLTFYDADTNTRIYSFSQLYQQKLFPVFRSAMPMFILAQKI